MNPLKLVDEYTARARILPGLLAVLPIAVTIYAWDPGNAFGWDRLGGLLSGFGGTILLAFIARDLGKRAEERLYKKWGGRPTEQMLMHSGPIEPTLRARRHRAIDTLFPDLTVPTMAEEADDQAATHARFHSITELLIGRARANKKDYPLVFEENCNYGFRRNMYGMRWLGFAIALVGSIVLGVQIYIHISTRELVATLTIVFEAVNIASCLVWVFWVNEKAVRKGAELYAARLLETLDTVSFSDV